MFDDITLLVYLLHDPLFLRLVSQRQLLIIFAISCQRCCDPIPFIRFNPQLIEGVSPREIDDLGTNSTNKTILS